MKKVFARTFVMLAGIALVVPFVAVALLVGARVVSEAGSTKYGLVLAALAFGGALSSGARNSTRGENEAGETYALHVSTRGEGIRRHAFMNTRGH